ncbi:MAG: maleylpyruvate isomerase family mycothiol-dependent enzyme [Acidimicrobiia bacterium]|nr:maleylpyruvate isomerase family mycothiol-dependent enzyme [Acidimicrobiia bacterium]
MPSRDEFLAHLDADSHLFAAAAARGLEADVPSCPGWTVRDLVVHIGEVISQKADLVAGGWADSWPPRNRLPAGVDPLDWYRREASRLYEVLSVADPETPAMTFGPDQTVAFWIRRMAHETVVHRIDAEQAHGYESAVDPQLAIDGVWELFDVYITGYPDWAEFHPGDDVVRVVVGDETRTVRLGRFTGAKNDRDYDLPTTIFSTDDPHAIVSGYPDRVLLWMWGRAPLDDVNVSGDVATARRFRTACAARETAGSR